MTACTNCSHLPAFAYALGLPRTSARLKAQCEDFQVIEELGFELDDQGEHLCLWIEKRDRNTADVGRLLASFAGVRPQHVSHCGLKDKRAVTRQWFSVCCRPADEPNWQDLNRDGLSVLQVRRHGRKLRIGAHRSNRFDIHLRGISKGGDELTQRLHYLRRHGFPNYFGEQRFGCQGANLAAALAMFERLKPATGKKFKPRGKDKLLLSSARSFLFNQVLSQRVVDGNWNTALDGDVFQFDDGSTVFHAAIDEELQQRLERQEIHPTGPLFGVDGVQVKAASAELEARLLEQQPQYCEGLLQAGVQSARRALRAIAYDLDWQLDGGDLRLRFRLKRGQYATSLLREIVQPQSD